MFGNVRFCFIFLLLFLVHFHPLPSFFTTARFIFENIPLHSEIQFSHSSKKKNNNNHSLLHHVLSIGEQGSIHRLKGTDKFTRYYTYPKHQTHISWLFFLKSYSDFIFFVKMLIVVRSLIN